MDLPAVREGRRQATPKGGGKVNCAECLKRMWPEDPRVGFTDFSTGRYYAPICQGCGNESKTNDLEDRVGNLEAISAQPGRAPRYYQEQLQQLRGEIAYLHKKITEQPVRVKKKGSYD